jgi:hypothetical protein
MEYDVDVCMTFSPLLAALSLVATRLTKFNGGGARRSFTLFQFITSNHLPNYHSDTIHTTATNNISHI